MKTLRKTLTIFSGTIAALALAATNVSAELTNPVVEGALGSGSEEAKTGDTFGTYFINLWNSILTIGAVFVLVFFIWGAVEWIASGGDKGKVENARNRITQSVIGLIILVGSYVILGFISQLFFGDDFNLLQINVPDALEV